MNFEYLIFNAVVISGPAFFGSQKCCYIWDRWKQILIAVAIPAIPFLLWDVLVTGTHWNFNPDFVSEIKIINLPIEEILFFITVPFACLFTWEMIIRKAKEKIINLKWLRILLHFSLLAGIYFFSVGKQYTGLTLCFIFLANLVDQLLKTNLLFDRRFYFYLLLIAIFTLIFNGYLTWRPVVTYGVEYQLDFRIITIPVEDFFYGISLLFMNTSFYMYLLGKSTK
ncbi:MAG TPA: lycopene cyclase domain-containing protein [Ignavibacteriaceae bacterium]|nr:lycopene cyclase domain-containing protein [Ignavibacteriaceae bacterium]